MNDLSDGKNRSGLSEPDVAMLTYVRKLTLRASSIDESDVAQPREAGFSDRAILEINLAAAYMNFVNRVAEGLGVALEPLLQSFTR